MTTARIALSAAATLVLLASSAPSAVAQTSPSPSKGGKWELRFTSGAFVPTGDQRNVLKDAQVSGAQLAWVLRPSLAITGAFAWARSRDIATTDAPKLDVFTSDLGVEVRPARWPAGRAGTVRPFVGVGAGMRSYNYRRLDVDATHNLAGYAAAGGELDIGRVGVRIEARDYVAGFKPLVSSGKSHIRNDVVIMAALRFNSRRAPRD